MDRTTGLKTLLLENAPARMHTAAQTWSKVPTVSSPYTCATSYSSSFWSAQDNNTAVQIHWQSRARAAAPSKLPGTRPSPCGGMPASRVQLTLGLREAGEKGEHLRSKNTRTGRIHSQQSPL